MYKYIIKIVLLSLFFIPIFAENQDNNISSNDSMSAYEKEIKNTFNAGLKVAIEGPKKIKIFNQAVIDLPEGFAYIPNPEASKMMYALGNTVSEEFNGLIIPLQGDEWWFVTINYTASGYIKDDDAKDWDAKEMLEQYKEGTESANKERIRRNIPAVEVVDWVEQPTYYGGKHQAIWSISLKDKDQPMSQSLGINYNTLVLGREGYVSLNLITSLDQVDALKPIGKTLVDHLSFVEGKRYQDVDFKTDKIAEYGLAALITGVVAKKLGFFAIIAAFLAKFGKLIAIAVFGGGYAAIKRFFSKKKQSQKDGSDTINDELQEHK